MNSLNKTRQTRRQGPKFVAMALAAALTLGTANVNAWIPVQETGTSLIQHLLNQINTYQSKIRQGIAFAEEKTRWLRTLEQYRQALIQVQAAMNSFGLPQGANVSPVPEDYLVAETCGGKADFSPAGLFKTFVLNTDGDLKQQQTQICVNIRTMQNRKYNDSLQFLNDTVPSMQKSLSRLFSLRLGSNDQGNVQGVDSESLRTANDLSLAAQNWKARMDSYDAYIKVQQENQQVLAKAALKGKPSIYGEIVKTAALKTALSIK